MLLLQMPDGAERESILMDLLGGSEQLSTAESYQPSADVSYQLSADVSLQTLSQRCPVSNAWIYICCLLLLLLLLLLLS